MLRKSILVLATAFAVGSAVVSTSAFAFGPLPLGGPYPLGGPHFSGPPHFGGGLHFGGPLGGPHLGGGHFRGGYSERFAGHYGGSHDRRWGRYALGQGYGDSSGCYVTTRSYHTSTGWHTRQVSVCD